MLSWGNEKITNSIFLLPSCQQEVFNIIKELKNRKGRRALDIETKFIKLANPIISFFLSELLNLCVSTGTSAVATGGQGGRAPPNDCLCPPILIYSEYFFEAYRND